MEVQKGEAKLEFKYNESTKKLELVVAYDGKGADAQLGIQADPAYFLDKLALAIPGGVDDTVFALLKKAFL